MSSSVTGFLAITNSKLVPVLSIEEDDGLGKREQEIECGGEADANSASVGESGSSLSSALPWNYSDVPGSIGMMSLMHTLLSWAFTFVLHCPAVLIFNLY